MLRNTSLIITNSATWHAHKAPNTEYLIGSSTFTITLLRVFSSKYVLVTKPYPIKIHCNTFEGTTQSTDTTTAELRE